ncbi:uncharacterized protein LOC135384470 [Ornithodoros turicata]|uniref:uncharacterized protein LOC135384470 n=1 Tax=Ornithodoros turicata TaxID=34597 RepID=UPI003139B08A
MSQKSQIANFRPVLDEDGTVRVSGRLQYSTMPKQVKQPVLIPHGHKLAELVVEAAHRRLLHSGVQDTITEVRERYWVPRCRQLAKRILFRCTSCALYRAKPAAAPMAPLPVERVNESGPFEVVGIDFAGPLFMKSSEGSDQKAYIALFTCAVTRVIHLELVSGMTMTRLLLAFKRFTAGRGLPSVIYTDNAPTFKRAEKEMEGIKRAKLPGPPLLPWNSLEIHR